jgi:integrase
MKGGREHRVPLSGGALAIVKALYQADSGEFVFVGHKPGKPLSRMTLGNLLRRMKVDDATVHGFRSAFRDWAAECTNFPNEVCEAALAHAVANKVEAAYRRGDLFEKRRKLMDAWAAFCAAPRTAGKIVPMQRTALALQEG